PGLPFWIACSNEYRDVETVRRYGRMKKALILLLITVLGLPLLGVFAWYCVSFLPHLSELHAIERQEATGLSSASPELYRIAVAAESKFSIRNYAMREAYWYLGRKEMSCKQLPDELNW